MDTFWVRDEHHDGPLPPLERGIWVEPMTTGFCRSMEDWGIPVQGFTTTLIDGWVYGSFALLDDDAEVARRVERRLALPRDAEASRGALARRRPAGMALEAPRRGSGPDELDDLPVAERVRAGPPGIAELCEARFSDIAVAAPYARWVLLTEDLLGWDAAHTMASSAS